MSIYHFPTEAFALEVLDKVQTSLTGGPEPVQGELVLCSARMNAVLEISVGDRLARAQAGVVTGALQNQVADQGMFYWPNPTSASYCTR